MAYWTVVEPYWDDLPLDGADAYRRFHEAMPKAARDLTTAHWLYSEVCNGGFHQFFTNPTGVVAPEAVEGLEAMGLGELASVGREAMRFFGPVYPREQGERIAMLERYSDERSEEEWNPFERLDDLFYDMLELGEGDDAFVRAADSYAERSAG